MLLHLTIQAPTKSLFIGGCGPWAMGVSYDIDSLKDRSKQESSWAQKLLS